MISIPKQSISGRDKNRNEPTRAQIHELTAEIRKEWTPRERQRHMAATLWLSLLEIPLQPRRRAVASNS